MNCKRPHKLPFQGVRCRCQQAPSNSPAGAPAGVSIMGPRHCWTLGLVLTGLNIGVGRCILLFLYIYQIKYSVYIYIYHIYIHLLYQISCNIHGPWMALNILGNSLCLSFSMGKTHVFYAGKHYPVSLRIWCCHGQVLMRLVRFCDISRYLVIYRDIRH